MRNELEGEALNVRRLDPYAEAKRMHPSSLPPLRDDEIAGNDAVVIAFPVRPRGDRGVTTRTAAAQRSGPAVAQL